MTRNWVQPIPTPEAFRINRILFDVQHDRAEEARFFADPDAYIAERGGLSSSTASALARNDIGKLYLLGSSPYLLRAYCLQLRVPEHEYLAALRAVAEEADHG